MIKLVTFDLDGTLLDTVADLAAAANYALRQCGFPEHEPEAFNFFVGNGIKKLFERALPEEEKTEGNIARIGAKFLPYYDSHNTDLTKPYPGISELLSALRSEGIAMGVASNKYQSATRKLVEYYFPDIPFVEVLGQHEGIPIKPDPAILSQIAATAGVRPEEAVHVGDSGVDMQTAANAGFTAIGVTWGFRPRSELQQFSPEHIVDTAAEILGIILNGNNRSQRLL